jgi:hypothetical protein
MRLALGKLPLDTSDIGDPWPNFFGVMTLDQGMDGASFALGVRNSHSKQFRLSIVVGLRIFVCSNLSFAGDFNILLAKHSKHLSLKNAISIGIDEAQRGFEPMQIQVSAWKEIQISDDQARLSIFKAFVEDELDAPSPHVSELTLKDANFSNVAHIVAFSHDGPVAALVAVHLLPGARARAGLVAACRTSCLLRIVDRYDILNLSEASAPEHECDPRQAKSPQAVQGARSSVPNHHRFRQTRNPTCRGCRPCNGI